VSSTQAVLVALAVVIFVAGWAARGRREAHERSVASQDGGLAELDRAIGVALTSFQAVLALWQTQGRASPDLAARVLATFEQRRDAAANKTRDEGLAPGMHEPLAKVSAALDRLTDELAPFREGLPLDAERERALFRAERELTAARAELLLAAARPPALTRAGSETPESG
jgi:hypothetical protein